MNDSNKLILGEGFDLILSDPAWKQSKGGKKNVRPKSSGEKLEYTTISLEDIEDLQKQVRDLSNPNHVLFLWTIDKYLHESEQMIKRLGYKLHARMIWNKVTGIPAAFTVRYGHEYLLYCYHGKLLPVAKSERGKIHTVFTEQVKPTVKNLKQVTGLLNAFIQMLKKLKCIAEKKEVDGMRGVMKLIVT